MNTSSDPTIHQRSTFVTNRFFTQMASIAAELGAAIIAAAATRFEITAENKVRKIINEAEDKVFASASSAGHQLFDSSRARKQPVLDNEKQNIIKQNHSNDLLSELRDYLREDNLPPLPKDAWTPKAPTYAPRRIQKKRSKRYSKRRGKKVHRLRKYSARSRRR